MSYINYFMLTWRQEILRLVDRASRYIFVEENKIYAQFIVNIRVFHQTPPDDGRWIRPKPVAVFDEIYSRQIVHKFDFPIHKKSRNY